MSLPKVKPIDISQKHKYERFYSLVQTQEKKRRKCLRCKKIFVSWYNDNRICEVCNKINKNAGKHADGLGK